MIMANALEDIDFAGKVLQELLGQFRAEYRFDGDRFFRGLWLVGSLVGSNWSMSFHPLVVRFMRAR